ncbi:transcriptional regulator [Rhodococcus jostii RHA1] [Mycobacterium shimoidei]|uniref:Transcriptional regulator [Rhodococcus jostii RHA1] n=1 Tax=Mycobacterium shimoidei TaxID=29313 RepID=A0A375YZK2_MYCSH|nr:transcriptional regulator [Mycobacterium shimoidei]SRX94165.1 transcriptional regulator [Rhodococcus jostii RHA1] [Mycobacterium shimoidei]
MDDSTGRRRRGPQNRQRERVLDLVRASDGPVDAVELAEQLRLHVTTARFHLERLCEQGLVYRTRVASTGVGRPRTGYVAAQEYFDYQSLAELLALELGDTVEKRRRRAERVGRRWAQRVAVGSDTDTDAAAGTLDRGAQRTAELFRRMGFGPELTPPATPGTRRLLLHACPVRELAAAHPEVGCALHRGLLEGLLDPALRAELQPFAEPELCIAQVIADD